MEIIFCYFVIYLIEALILWQYCSDLFLSDYSRVTEGLIFLAAYFLLFVVSLSEIYWVNLLVFMIANFVIIILLYRVKWYTAFFHTCITTILMSLSELGVLSIISQFASNFYAERTYFRNLTLLTVFSKLIYFFLLRIIVRLLNHGKDKNVTPDRGTIFLNFTPIISLYICITLTGICLNTKLSLVLDWMISASSILLLIFNMLIFWIYQNNQKNNYEFMKLQLQLQKEYDSTEYYHMLLKQDESQKILIHDVKKHLQSIAILNERDAKREIADYIHRILHSPALQDSVQVCHNELLNTILCRYIQTCQENNIALRVDIRNGLLESLSYDELTALFCNLLDNAVESASTISDSFIDLNVTYNREADFTIISLINSCKRNPFSEKTGKLISSKNNTLRHGYGMKSVYKVVEKYDGNMSVYLDKDAMEFHTVITLKV